MGVIWEIVVVVLVAVFIHILKGGVPVVIDTIVIMVLLLQRERVVMVVL
jgi:hypothetical protein